MGLNWFSLFAWKKKSLIRWNIFYRIAINVIYVPTNNKNKRINFASKKKIIFVFPTAIMPLRAEYTHRKSVKLDTSWVLVMRPTGIKYRSDRSKLQSQLNGTTPNHTNISIIYFICNVIWQQYAMKIRIPCFSNI